MSQLLERLLLLVVIFKYIIQLIIFVRNARKIMIFFRLTKISLGHRLRVHQMALIARQTMKHTQVNSMCISADCVSLEHES